MKAKLITIGLALFLIVVLYGLWRMSFKTRSHNLIKEDQTVLDDKTVIQWYVDTGDDSRLIYARSANGQITIATHR